MRETMVRAASELRLSTRHVYNYLARYRDKRRVSALLPRRSGTRKPRIGTTVESIIAMTLREMWLRPEQLDLPPIVEEIRARCAESVLRLVRRGALQTHPSCHQCGSAH